MIANPEVPLFRYDPYSKKLTRERYDHDAMTSVRSSAIRTARKSIQELDEEHGPGNAPDDSKAPIWGVILGTLGRQGSFKQLQSITRQLTTFRRSIPFMPILLSELSPAKLALFQDHISTFIQTSCPRLSIDWGYAFSRPLLNPYECAVAIGETQGWRGDGMGGEGVYPMDFYAAGSPAALARIKGADA